MSTENNPFVDGRTREGKALRAASAPVADTYTEVGSSEPAKHRETPEEARLRAEARIREIRGNPDLIDGGGERDKYWAPPPPDGWDYQWKLKAVVGQDDLEAIRRVEMAGWTPVPLSRHPELMPRDWKGDTIDVGGLLLMERPKLFTDQAREEERRAAREAVYMKEAAMKAGRDGDLGKRQVNRFSKSHSAIAVPDA
jgi:hypothetical protein